MAVPYMLLLPHNLPNCMPVHNQPANCPSRLPSNNCPCQLPKHAYCASPAPQVVFRGLGELEALADEAGIELLHLNCSNRVLAHLPYMIALDHTRQAVVLAIR